MIDWEQIFDKFGFDYSILQKFKTKGGIRLLANENEFEMEKDWLKNYQLGFDIIPLFTNDESDSVGIFSSGFLKGKIIIMNHGNLDFTPRFRNLDSFLSQIANAKNEDFFDWQDLPLSTFDYPLNNNFDNSDENILDNSWELINKSEFVSEENRELLIKTAMFFTPPAKLESIMSFLKDKDSFIVDSAAWLLGIFHKYEPAKSIISDLINTRYKDHYWRKDFYGGEFEKKGIWKKLFG